MMTFKMTTMLLTLLYSSVCFRNRLRTIVLACNYSLLTYFTLPLTKYPTPIGPKSEQKSDENQSIKKGDRNQSATTYYPLHVITHYSISYLRLQPYEMLYNHVFPVITHHPFSATMSRIASGRLDTLYNKQLHAHSKKSRLYSQSVLRKLFSHSSYSSIRQQIHRHSSQSTKIHYSLLQSINLHQTLSDSIKLLPKSPLLSPKCPSFSSQAPIRLSA